ncbi:hypothetical protein [Rathayibacter sp. VKM Ac-2760]|uniref:hypothetical protein n=1 Tax=Rathayibacter sp. VKM Ac-2760 TaxID=2609253 RepID=UPI0013176797|nr:hypothetical protein [Rathayibacter sp. VKM Ac-2760]QHC59214.1 hypothetical protein GSU72_12095 [Rathayibacter sp. VKM Ac-2760]
MLVALVAAGALLLTATPALAQDAAPIPVPTNSATDSAPPLIPGAQPDAAVPFINGLTGGESLGPNESLRSDHTGAAYTFVMQTDGNAVLYDPQNHAVFATGTEGRGDHLDMQEDGDVVVSSADGTPVWTTGTDVEDGAHLVLQQDGNLVLYRENGTPAWANSVGHRIAEPPFDVLATGQVLRRGHQLTSEDGRYRAVLQRDGDFVGYGPQGVLWRTGTSGADNRLVMQTDGNAVIYGADGSVKWSTGTHGADLRLGLNYAGSFGVFDSSRNVLWDCKTHLAQSPTVYAANYLLVDGPLVSADGRFRAVLQKDGNFVVYGPSGAVWSTSTSGIVGDVTLYGDGTLAVRSYTGAKVWSVTPRAGAVGPFRLVLQDDGNLVEYDAHDQAVWASR